ncbi:MAG: hypothetical protein QGH39_01495 [Candidatus Thermoplasmatota archaeon]|nr:hypothetical protein [Candidatus Thermoplasmatota archaeon]MDP7264214.1 hypothetical protein [Candidatus Thermoplasmatota archaeon]MDP7422589.1 hypothetical protein [bacterium]
MKNTVLEDFFPLEETQSGKGDGENENKQNDIVSSETLDMENIKRFFSEELERFRSLDVGKVKLIVYEYSTIKYTIREKRGRIFFKICDIYLMASPNVFRAVCRKMLRHYLNRKNTAADETLYKNFTRNPEVMKRWKTIRLERGRGKDILPPKGKKYDLEEIARRVIIKYFPDNFPLPRLGWSLRRAKRRFGHYDRDLHTVVVSRFLDSPSIPKYLVEYILYHEFLHIKHGEVLVGDKTWVHTSEFHKDEKNFHRYADAKKLLKKIVNG